MAKKTIEEIREFVKINSNGRCELMSNVYIDQKTPLEIKCSCGNIFHRKWMNLNENFIQCKECTNRMRSEKYRLPLIDVVKNINSTGCEYISGDYINEKSLLNIKCRCGKVFRKSYGKFMNGQDRCPDCGNENVRRSKIKYTLEDVQEKISERGYILLENKYIGAHERMRCKCSRGHEFDLIFSQYLNGCSGCSKCAVMEKSGTKHPNYSGGNSKVMEALRNCIESWRKKMMELYNFECPVSGEREKLEVHHLESFSSILDSCSRKCGIPVYKKLNQYKNYEDFIKLKNTVIEYHNSSVGILLSSNIHSDFHKKYGKEENTREQFNEYLINNYNVCLKDIEKKF